MMDHMIYIYAGLAFVLAGGGWFIGWHGGYNRARRDQQRDRERMAHKMMLNAQFGKGLVYDVNSLYPSALTNVQERNVQTLSEAIREHTEIMDRDE